MNSDRTISLTGTPELPSKFNMYKLENTDGSKIDQKNTLLSLFSKPGDPTSNSANQQAMMTQRRVYDKKRETWLDKAKKKNAFRSTIGVVNDNKQSQL